MKKFIHSIGFILLSMIFAMQSCSDKIVENFVEEEVVETGEDMIPITLDLSGIFPAAAATYGTNYPGAPATATPLEEAIVGDIFVYVFDNTYTCEKILRGPTSPVGPELVKVGTKHFIAVINGQTHIPSLPTTPSAVNYTSLRQMLTTPSASLPASPFLMVGEKSNVPVSTSSHTVAIDVERACAKITMSFTKSQDAATHNITVNSVTLNRGADRIYLLGAPSTNPTLNNISKTFSSFTPSGVVSNSPVYNYMADTTYTYANYCGTDTTKAVYFEIEAAINSPGNIRKARFYLGEYKATATDTVYDIRRNYWYDVQINMIDPGMDSLNVTINACPWNLADTITKIEGAGGEFVTATPFKLVKNLTSYDLSMDNNIALINTHTKGASWIDLKVTNGTPWTLKLKGASDPRNSGVIGRKNTDASWTSFSSTSHLSGTGNDGWQRVYIYRPYNENAEPELGPALYIELDQQYQRDFIIQPRDLTPVPTNSYILRRQLGGVPTNETRAYIPLAGVYSYWEDYLLANGDSIPGGNTLDITAQLVWQDRPGVNTVVKNISVINKNKRDSAYIYVEAGAEMGNAVVAMKVNNITYWSFHLWVTEYNPYEAAGQKLYRVSPTKANVFMDRNLGALYNQYDANGDARGLFYQYGRKDPFPKSISWTNNAFVWYNSSGVSQPNILNSSTLAPKGTESRPLKAIPGTLNNPNTLYRVSPWPLQVENDSLWITRGGNKTAFDPCPEGWRVPIQASNGGSSFSPWEGLDSNFGYDVSALYTNGRYNSTVGYYPLSGYIGTSNTSVTVDANKLTNYWTSWPGVASGAGIGMGLTISGSGGALSSTINKTYGNQIRCVVDVKYLIKTGGGVFGISGGPLIHELTP